VPAVRPVNGLVYTPPVVSESAIQVDQTARRARSDEVPIQIPRAEILAGVPRDSTFAPSVALVWVIAVAVGVETVGSAGMTGATFVIVIVAF